MMKSLVHFVLIAVILTSLAVMSPAQSANWVIDSGYSHARMSVDASTNPASRFDLGVARVSGAAILDKRDLTKSVFAFSIYPADVRSRPIEDEGTWTDSSNTNLTTYSDISFRSTGGTLLSDGGLEVTGGLTLTHMERPSTSTVGEAYDGPVYGEPIVHSMTREATFIFKIQSTDDSKNQGDSRTEISASTQISFENFPELLSAIRNTSWPVVVEDENCQTPSTIGEDYSGISCTGTLVEAVIPAEPPPGIGEDYHGLEASISPAGNQVSVLVHLELEPQGSLPVQAMQWDQRGEGRWMRMH
jgi:polyisoprenoid-binding protein YceI